MNQWNQEGIPHKGWVCFDVVDLGSGNSEPCRMCGNENVRFLHYMKHAEHEPLEVGCVCAEKMSNDYLNPKKIEGALRNRAKRRETFLRGTWQLSAKGNYYIKFKGTLLTVFRTRMGQYGIIARGATFAKYFKTVEAARIAAFDFYEQIK